MRVVRVKVLFFGMLKDVVGTAAEQLEVASGVSLGSVYDSYKAKFPALSQYSSSIVLARNHEFADASAVLADGDEIAFLPPVSGGADPWIHKIVIEPEGHFFALTRQPIDTKALAQDLLQDHDGAFVNFEGVVRNNSGGRSTKYLEYECYEPMAIKLMAQIGSEIAKAHSISRIAIVHRLGHMEIGEASVAVLAFSPHRRPAFDAALEGINKLKKLVPIWKKEFFVDGEVWVEGEWDDSVVPR